MNNQHLLIEMTFCRKSTAVTYYNDDDVLEVVIMVTHDTPAFLIPMGFMCSKFNRP